MDSIQSAAVGPCQLPGRRSSVLQAGVKFWLRPVLSSVGGVRLRPVPWLGKDTGTKRIIRKEGGPGTELQVVPSKDLFVEPDSQCSPARNGEGNQDQTGSSLDPNQLLQLLLVKNKLAAEFTALAMLAEPQLIQKLEGTIFHSCGVGWGLALGSSSADSLQFPCRFFCGRAVCSRYSSSSLRCGVLFCVCVSLQASVLCPTGTFQCGTWGGAGVPRSDWSSFCFLFLRRRRSELLLCMPRLSDSECYM